MDQKPKHADRTDTAVEDQEQDVLVVDNGSQSIRCGFGSEPAHIPRATFPCVVGRQRGAAPLFMGMGLKDYYVGKEAKNKRVILVLKCPIENGKIENWTAMEHIWHHAFYNELRVDPGESRLRTIVSENAGMSKEDRERIAAVMFDTFNTSALCIASRPMMALYSSGRTTGVVVHIGHKTAAIVPIHNGCIEEKAVIQLTCSGFHVTEYLFKILTERGFTTISSFGWEWLQDIKEQHCYVALDVDSESEMAKLNPSLVEKTVSRRVDPEDDWVGTLRTERFQCAEVLFNPSLTGISFPGLHQVTFQAINRCDEDIRADLFKNIVMSGGTSNMPGIADRLCKEMSFLVSGKGAVAVQSVGALASYQGAHMVSSLPDFEPFWVTREQYRKEGPSAIHRMAA